MEHTTEYEDLIDDIVGLHLKCSRGTWTLDDSPIETGIGGFHVTIFPPTAQYGRIKWVDGRPADKVLQKYSDGFPGWEDMPEGWSGYTVVQGVAPNGEILTFTSALGARKTLKNVITQYRFRRKRVFPLCVLDTKPRGDTHGNIDPVLKIVGWVNASDFADFFPELAERPQLEAPSAQLSSAPKTIDVLAVDSHSGLGKTHVESLIDDIPF